MTNELLHITVVDIGRLTNLGWAVEGPSVSKSGVLFLRQENLSDEDQLRQRGGRPLHPLS